MNNLLRVSLRQNAIFLPATAAQGEKKQLTPTTSVLLVNLARLGFVVTEPLLYALNQTSSADQAQILSVFRDVMGVNNNWTPLVKNWEIPTGESAVDHILTFYGNVFSWSGEHLRCGHTIPHGTFPLDRYNGCPFCGKPMEFGRIENYGQGSKKTVLELWTEKEATGFLSDLLASKAPLDATQADSLKILLSALQVPVVKVGMKETLVLVVDECIRQNRSAEAAVLFSTPADILRYLWYKHTGLLQLAEPATLVRRATGNARHIRVGQDNSVAAKVFTRAQLRLKYDRKDCRMVAGWLNDLQGDIERLCESMHPKRGMWVRFIRALRLAEYSRREGFGRLQQLMDAFYNSKYESWQGLVDHFRLRFDRDLTFHLLKQRPGLFARSLFANMLWFGPEPALAAFSEVADKVPARLLFTLNSYASFYFDRDGDQVVRPLGGVNKRIRTNALLANYSEEQLAAMRAGIADLCSQVTKERFMALKTESKSIYIDPQLFKIPLSIGDRSTTVQDISSAVQGSRFAVEGDKVRLFMQWGVGLPAQPMDMDLSCRVIYDRHTETCSYSTLEIFGCKHSGDIRQIPSMVGTAEYIEVGVAQLKKAKANYVVFTSNAYSSGGITPNMVVGWMNSRYSMRISEKTGVAYDPSCVQHQVRIVNSLSKGLVFGVLDIPSMEVVWLEMPFSGQLSQNLDNAGIMALIKRVENKLSIGRLLQLKAEAQGLEIKEDGNADEVYTIEWAKNPAAVTRLLVD